MGGRQLLGVSHERGVGGNAQLRCLPCYSYLLFTHLPAMVMLFMSLNASWAKSLGTCTLCMPGHFEMAMTSSGGAIRLCVVHRVLPTPQPPGSASGAVAQPGLR
jgi:hypothetical protein